MRWRLYLEEYAPQFHYIKGERNTFADALSRLPRHEGRSDTEDHSSQLLNQQQNARDEFSDGLNFFVFTTLEDDHELIDCLLNFPEVTPDEPFALDFQTIANAQQNDPILQQFANHRPDVYPRRSIGNTQLILYERDGKHKICIPDSMLRTIIAFYHKALGHIGVVRLEQGIRQYFEHRHLHDRVREYVKTCDTCQRCKATQAEYGELPERVADFIPWGSIAVDLVGPWKFRDRHGFEHQFHALTIIDVVTNYVEIVRLDNKTAEHVSAQFRNQWLARYPRPNTVIFDPGTEFKGAFREQLTQFGITPAPTTTKNPQANAIVERLHQTIGDVLRAVIYENPPEHALEAAHAVDQALATAAYAARASIHSTLGTSPGSLVFNRDMLLDVPVIADLVALRDKRQAMIQKNLARANKKRVVHHDYKIGDEVLKLVYKPAKLEPRAVGPYRITQVHANGSVTVQKTPLTTERLNLRKIKPYFSGNLHQEELPFNVI